MTGWSAAGAVAALLGTACGGGPRAGDTTATTGAVASAAFRPLAPGDTLPPYAAATLAGDTARIAAGGPVTLVNVWATWCTSCREEMADLEAVHREFGAQGLRVLAVSVDDGDAARVRRFVEHERLTMPIAVDPAGAIQQAYRVVGVPETFLVGADGRLLWRQAGGLHGDVAAVRAAVTRALAGAPAGAPRS